MRKGWHVLGRVLPLAVAIALTVLLPCFDSTTTQQTALSKGSASREELQQLIFDIATASRNLVKNQTTWFRDDAMFRCGVELVLCADAQGD